VDKLTLKKLIKELKKWRAHATTLLSLYIPPGRPLSEVVDFLRQEFAVSQNIKLKQTREAVQSALQAAIDRLTMLRENLPNGVVVFAGRNEETGDFIALVFSPPEPVPLFFYRTDKEFHLEFLEPMVEESEIYGVIIVERDAATIGLIKPSGIEVLDEIEWYIPGKHHKGGQSQRRFDRIIEQMVEEFYRHVAEKANTYFVPLIEQKKLKGIILAGPGYAKQDFLKEAGEALDYRVRQLILDQTVDVGYQGYAGLKEVLEKAGDILAKHKFYEAYQEIEKFKYHLAKDDGYAVYGEEEIVKALELGALETIIVCEDRDDIEKLEEKASRYGAKIVLVYQDMDDYKWFKETFNCIAGISRYPLVM